MEARPWLITQCHLIIRSSRLASAGRRTWLSFHVSPLRTMSDPNLSRAGLLRRLGSFLAPVAHTPRTEIEVAKAKRLERLSLCMFAGSALCFLAAVLLKSEALAWVAAVPMVFARYYQLAALRVGSARERDPQEGGGNHLQSIRARRVSTKHELKDE